MLLVYKLIFEYSYLYTHKHISLDQHFDMDQFRNYYLLRYKYLATFQNNQFQHQFLMQNCIGLVVHRNLLHNLNSMIQNRQHRVHFGYRYNYKHHLFLLFQSYHGLLNHYLHILLSRYRLQYNLFLLQDYFQLILNHQLLQLLHHHKITALTFRLLLEMMY